MCWLWQRDTYKYQGNDGSLIGSQGAGIWGVVLRECRWVYGQWLMGLKWWGWPGNIWNHSQERGNLACRWETALGWPQRGKHDENEVGGTPMMNPRVNQLQSSLNKGVEGCFQQKELNVICNDAKKHLFGNSSWFREVEQGGTMCLKWYYTIGFRNPDLVGAHQCFQFYIKIVRRL